MRRNPVGTRSGRARVPAPRIPTSTERRGDINDELSADLVACVFRAHAGGCACLRSETTLRAGPVGTADESPSLMLDLELFVGPPFAAAFRAAVHWLVFVGVL